VGDGKVILMAIVDETSLGLTEKDTDVFFIATTTNIHNPEIVLDKRSKTSSEEYVRVVNKNLGENFCEPTKGNSLTGIVRDPFWFIKKSKSVMEMMYGT
jgi:hypothetical protein